MIVVEFRIRAACVPRSCHSFLSSFNMAPALNEYCLYTGTILRSWAFCTLRNRKSATVSYGLAVLRALLSKPPVMVCAFSCEATKPRMGETCASQHAKGGEGGRRGGGTSGKAGKQRRGGLHLTLCIDITVLCQEQCRGPSF